MIRSQGARLLVMASVSALLIAASTVPGTPFDENYRRLGSMPLDQRLILAKNLERFDALPSERRAEILSLDAGIDALDPEVRKNYLATLRHYQLWQANLDPEDQKRLRVGSPAERIAIIAELRKKEAPGRSPALVNLGLPIGDLGSLPPIEVGNALRVWSKLSAAEKKRIEGYPSMPRPLQELTKIGRNRSIEVKAFPLDQQEALLKRLEESAIYKPLIVNLRNRQEKGEGLSPLKKKIDTRVPGLARPLHSLAESLHFLDHPPAPVTTANLSRFEADLPTWVRKTIDPLPPAEARRRLTILYREVYPHPSEMPVPAPPKTQAPKAGATPPPSSAPPTSF